MISAGRNRPVPPVIHGIPAGDPAGSTALSDANRGGTKMDIVVYPGKLRGMVKAPPSKSEAHRALICAALADGESRIQGISDSRDMEATLNCIKAAGAGVERDGMNVTVRGIGGSLRAGVSPMDAQNHPVFDCGESGSTFRFLLPVAAAAGLQADFTGKGRLPERPVTELTEEMKKHGITFLPEGRETLPFSIRGKLTSGVYSLPGNVSSQYFSGLLFALPLLEGDSEIQIEGELQSSAYLDLTLDMIRRFGISVEDTGSGYRIKGGQKYRAMDVRIEGDYSNAAFWLVAGATGSDIAVQGLDRYSRQGDSRILDILEEMGAAVFWSDDIVRVSGYGLESLVADCGEIPDIVPILAVAACTSEDQSGFLNAGRLRLKESDRLKSTAAMLAKLGADIQLCGDKMDVYAPEGLYGEAVIDGANDHRIVMSAAIAALRCENSIKITGAEAVEKSYPDFFDVFRALGGRADVISDR